MFLEVNMSYLEKEINFKNDKVITVEYGDKIYISVKQVCHNLGMDKSRSDHQVQKIQQDETLRMGIKKLSLNFQSQIRNTVFIELDYLPLWLAKINPARFDEELKDKLTEYQLHCKDVLADAFLGKRELDKHTGDTILDNATGNITGLKGQLKNTIYQLSGYYRGVMNEAGVKAAYYERLLEYIK